MKTYTTALLAFALLACNAGEPVPQTTEQHAPAEAVQEDATMACGSVQAYAISKGLVLQAVHTPDGVTFPFYDEEMVNTDHAGHYAVMGYFYRADRKVEYRAALTCQGDKWDVAWVTINGVQASQGMNL